MKHTRWIVIYDIRDPKRLVQVAKTCESFGVRVQYSAFEIQGSFQILSTLRKKLQDIIDPVDSIAYFPVCEKDWQKRIKLGPGPFQENIEHYTIL